MMLIIITAISMFLVVYHHVGYPLLLSFLSKRTSEIPAPIHNVDAYPSITVLMPAYNEEKFVAEKIRNLACLDYPNEKLNIIIAADGCSDKTVDIAYKTCCEPLCRDLRVQIFDFPQNRGKVCVLNSVIPLIKSELLVLSDVSSLISIDALKIVAERFSDLSIGALNGNYRLLNPGSHGESTYWEYQRKIKIGEEKLGSVMGAHGAFYVIRTALFEKLPQDCVNDDFVIPMNIVARGKRVAYDFRLNAVELEKSSQQQNWLRRLRISFGNAQQIVLLKQLFHPKYKGVALAFLSGKALRVTMPLFMIISFVGSILLSDMWIFAIASALQTGIYAIAAGVHFHPHQPIKLFNSINYLVSGHLANLIGGLRYILGNRLNAWS